MPVLHVWRHDDNAALRERDRLVTLGLALALTGRADQRLTAAGGGGMLVSVVATAGLKDNDGQANRHLFGGLIGVLQVGLADEVLGKSAVALTCAEHVGAVEGFLVSVIHRVPTSAEGD